MTSRSEGPHVRPADPNPAAWCAVDVIARQSPTPIRAYRRGDVVVFDLARPVPTPAEPDRDWTERTYLLLDVGVQLKLPHWWLDDEPATWYVDLVRIDEQGGHLVVRDLYIDVIVPTDGRPYRTLDLDEFADAIASGALSVEDAVDGLRRWQAFLDDYLHIRGQKGLDPVWRNFPPACIRSLMDLTHLPDGTRGHGDG